MALVVGVDGSVSCLDAVRVAVLKGGRMRTSVRLVHAFAWPPPLISSLLGAALLGPAVLGTAESELRREARTMLAGAEAMARQTDPAVPVERRLVTGRPAPVLIEQAGTAEMVVLGDRGRGGFTGLPVGSIAMQVVAHSPVPVLVVKGNTAAEGPVLVGSEDVLALAAREAQSRRAPVLAETSEQNLIGLSESAQLLVIGSAARHLLDYVHCPVLIVPDSQASLLLDT